MARDNNGAGQPRNGPAEIVQPTPPGQLPEFVPMPTGMRCEYYSGLRRGSLSSLVLPCEKNGYKPPVKSISLRKPGNAKGTRLIVLASLLEYLRGLQRQQIGEGGHSESRAGEALAA